MNDVSCGRCCSRNSNAFNVKLFRVVQYLLKAMALLCDGIMTAHFGMLAFCGHGLWFCEYVAGFSLCGFILLFIVSYLLNFCWRYRACLVHNFLGYTLMVIMRNVDLGRCAVPLEFAVLVSGIILIIIVINHLLR